MILALYYPINAKLEATMAQDLAKRLRRRKITKEGENPNGSGNSHKH